VLAWMGRTSRSRRPCARGEVLCTEPGRSHYHPCPDWCRAGSRRQHRMWIGGTEFKRSSKELTAQPA
jgi:hypothetical protein